MSEEFTRDLPDSRSFEERLFARFDAMDSRVEAMGSRFEARFDAMASRFEAINSRLDAIESRFEARFNQVDARLDNLDVRVQALETRALDTKPIWERALAEILEVKHAVEDLQRNIHLLIHDVMQVRADQVRVERRMDALEGRA